MDPHTLNQKYTAMYGLPTTLLLDTSNIITNTLLNFYLYLAI